MYMSGDVRFHGELFQAMCIYYLALCICQFMDMSDDVARYERYFYMTARLQTTYKHARSAPIIVNATYWILFIAAYGVITLQAIAAHCCS